MILACWCRSRTPPISTAKLFLANVRSVARNVTVFTPKITIIAKTNITLKKDTAMDIRLRTVTY